MFPSAQSLGGDGLEWDRLRFRPEIELAGSYSDNIYRDNVDEKEDYIGRLTADIALDLAIVPSNYFTLHYKGDFLSYQNSDNFRNNHHLGTVSFTSKSVKGSHLIVGAQGQLTAIQPYSETDVSKDYIYQNYYGDFALAVLSFTEIGAIYSYSQRDFDKSEYEDDNYTRDTVDAYILNKRSRIIPLLLQYRFINHDNNDSGSYTTDYNSHTFFLGGRWDPEGKLSGALRVGYFWVEFDQPDIDNCYGLAADTNLVYDFSEITSFSLTLERGINQPTRAERETGDLYLYTDARLGITHHKWPKLETRLYGFYSIRDYKSIFFLDETIRTDHFYRVGLSFEYILKSWVSFVVDYRYQQRDSDVPTVEYDENLATISVVFSL